jgi:hypothetical protein
MNEMKWYEIWPRPKGGVQQIFQTLPLNSGKRLNKSCLKFVPFCKASMKVRNVLMDWPMWVFNCSELRQFFIEANAQENNFILDCFSIKISLWACTIKLFH